MLFEKRALVTGAGSKIAKSIIEQLRSNYYIIKHKLNYEKNYFCGDLSNEEVAMSLFDSIKTPLDLIVCCVGGIKLSNNIRPQPDDCLNISYSDAKKLFEKNFFTTFLTCKFGIKKLRKDGNIIIIGSSVVSRPRDNGEVCMYDCAKSAVHEYAVHLSNQLAGTNIKINCIASDGNDLKNLNHYLIKIIEKKI